MSPPPPPSIASSWTRFEPVASTSRVPYSARHTPTAARAPTRAFSTSSSSRNGRSRAYLIHPMARQRLTNLTFLSAGLLSVLTVSLAMSGTFGEGAAPGCPARVRTGVALEEEQERRAAGSWEEEEGGDGDDGGGGGRSRTRRKWWESSKAKGRFLEDPVVVAPPAPSIQSPNAVSTAASPRHATVSGLGERAADPNTTQTPFAAESQTTGGVVGSGRSGGDWRSGWKGLRDPEERVV